MPRESRLQRRLREARDVLNNDGKKAAEWARSMNGKTIDCVTIDPHRDPFKEARDG